MSNPLAQTGIIFQDTLLFLTIHEYENNIKTTEKTKKRCREEEPDDISPIKRDKSITA